MAKLQGQNISGLHPVCAQCHQLAEFTGDQKHSIQRANLYLGIDKQETGAEESRLKAVRKDLNRMRKAIPILVAEERKLEQAITKRNEIALKEEIFKNDLTFRFRQMVQSGSL